MRWLCTGLIRGSAASLFPLGQSKAMESQGMQDEQYWIERLRLREHPEGGFFRETYRSGLRVDRCCIGSGFDGSRSVSTAIYYLLRTGDVSVLHRIRADEVWHHYAGETLCLHVLDPSGSCRTLRLGKDVDDGDEPQVVVPAGSWFGAVVRGPSAYALVGCTVSPGFDFNDFEIGKRDDLIRQFPEHRRIIEELTY